MSVSIRSVFSKTCLVAVIATGLSACSTTTQVDQNGLGGVGGTLSTIGQKTADWGSRALQGAWDFFGIDGIGQTQTHTNRTASDTSLLDEVDLALMDESPNAPELTAIKIPTVSRVSTTQDDADSADTNSLLMAKSPDSVQAPEKVAAAEIFHDVQASETLWDIAKKTTGDANNWHVLADINMLAPNAAVFPGQRIVIPADLAKPELAHNTIKLDQAASQQPEMARGEEKEADTSIASANSNPTEPARRLIIPDTTTASTIQKISPINAAANAQPFTVDQGETLWDLAKRTTGDATNWQAIADQNGFNAKQATLVRQGQTIFIPNSIVKSTKTSVTKAASPQKSQQPEKINDSAVLAVADDEAIDAASAVLAGTNLNNSDSSIKIVEAKFQISSDNNVQPGDGIINQVPLMLDGSDTPPQSVMVSGTYYPKAIYNDADFSSSLLMRVSPGTKLLVSKAIGPWLQVSTDKGLGFVHKRDIK